jgi:hypothetical protein
MDADEAEQPEILAAMAAFMEKRPPSFDER